MKKNVCFLVTSLNSGGIENYLLRFIQHYPDELNATVLCKSGETGDLEQQYMDNGAGISKLKLGYFNPFPYFKLYRFLKRNRFDSICDFTGNYAALPLSVAKAAGVTRRLAFYRGSSNRFKETLFRLAYNNWMNLLLPIMATRILSNSKAAFTFFFPKKSISNPSKYNVIYNGIDADTFLLSKDDLRKELGIPEDGFVVGHVGRFNRAKNHKTIVEVVIQLAKKYIDFYAILCGQDVDVGLEERIKDEGLTGQIKLFGYRNDVINVLNTLDCFYFPSITEGQPNSLIEAMIADLPLVTSNIDPILETLPGNLAAQVAYDPLDTKAHVKALENYYHHRTSLEKFKATEFARKNFDAGKQFSQFFDTL